MIATDTARVELYNLCHGARAVGNGWLVARVLGDGRRANMLADFAGDEDGARAFAATWNALDLPGRLALDALLGVLTAGRVSLVDLAVYTGAAWAARGEEYGTSAAFVVVHEGAAAGRFLGMDKAYESGGSDCYAGYEHVADALRATGHFLEDCTRWYSAVYPVAS